MSKDLEKYKSVLESFDGENDVQVRFAPPVQNTPEVDVLKVISQQDQDQEPKEPKSSKYTKFSFIVKKLGDAVAELQSLEDTNDDMKDFLINQIKDEIEKLENM